MEEHKVELRNSRLQGPLDSDVDELGLDRLTDTVPFPKRGVIIMAIAAAVGFALYAALPKKALHYLLSSRLCGLQRPCISR